MAPAIWGTTYLVTTQFLPPDRPLLAGVIRALPAGLLLVLITRRLPRGIWWWRSLVLGALNIGIFFALLFVGAYRLPGGVAATMGAVQPLLVAGFAAGLLGERLSLRTVLAGVTGLVGVSLLVLRADAALDAVGVVAALGGAAVMALGVVLSKRWTSPAPLLATTGWQLVAGGVLLLPVALLVEGPPPAALSGANLGGYAYLSLIGAALAYVLWFRGVRGMPATHVTFLSLLSPVVATALGWLVLGQQLSPLQGVGALLVLAAVIVAQKRGHHQPRALRITVFGAAGDVGSRVVAEALTRGHVVTAVSRDPSRLAALDAGVPAEAGDAANVADVVRLSAGQDVVISATRPAPGRECELAATASALVAGLGQTGARLLVVGGAASLTVPGSGGTTVLDAPDFPGALRPIAEACNAQLAVCRAEHTVDWAYLSPAAVLEPGIRTGGYRTGDDDLIVDAQGRSTISMEDLAVALLDEAERPAHHRTRFTVGY